MRLELTGAAMRNFIIDQKVWSLRVKREKEILGKKLNVRKKQLMLNL